MSPPALLYFGDKWDSPMLDADWGREVRQVPTPVGQLCQACDKPIEAGDRGLFQTALREVPADEATARIGGIMVSPFIEPIHAECHLRQGVGSVAHVTGRCSCRGFDEQDYPGTAHEEAQEIWRLTNEMRAGQGLPPLEVRTKP